MTDEAIFQEVLRAVDQYRAEIRRITREYIDVILSLLPDLAALEPNERTRVVQYIRDQEKLDELLSGEDMAALQQRLDALADNDPPEGK